jgi:multidrug efflux pump subunit AcrB
MDRNVTDGAAERCGGLEKRGYAEELVMNPILFALRRPLTVMVAIVAVVLCSILALGNLLPEKVEIGGLTIPVRSLLPTRGMPADIFPDLGVPIIYVAQPYGGMDPAQMEGFITNYYEYHFLYITGIHHVESKNIQGVALMKLFFHPGTNMAQAMAETVNYVNRARSFMPEGTVPPFIMRYDAGSVPVGYLVFESKTKSIGEIQDAALFRVRPLFASLPGVSAPPPFGGNQRTILVKVNLAKLNALDMSPGEVVTALSSGNLISPSGAVTFADQTMMVPVNSVVKDPRDLEGLAIRSNNGPIVYVRDVGRVEDGTDIATGYGLVNGIPSVYILVTKRADASTLSVVNEVKANMDKMRDALPKGISIRFEFDQSPYITRALWGLGLEGLLGAALTGVMVFLFLRDGRSVIVVVLNIPIALLGAVVALWLTGQTINLMTLGGLALAVGILVDEATVEVENIHTQFEHTPNIARAVRAGNAETAVPRLLAMLCILAVFIPSFFMQGAARNLFVPLSLAVGFSMVASYLLSSTFVPVVSVWLLRHYHPHQAGSPGLFSFARFRSGYARVLGGIVRLRWLVVAGYLGGVVLLVLWWLGGHPGLGREIFPLVDSGQFQLRLRAPDGTPLDTTRELTEEALREIGREVGPDNVAITVCLVGTASYNYPINAIYLWTMGPQEAVLRIALNPDSGIRVEALKETLRSRLKKHLTGWLERKLVAEKVSPAEAAKRVQGLTLSFEPADIVNEVMSFGSPTPVEVAISGPNLANNRAYAARVRKELDERIKSLRDLQYVQSLHYPTLQIELDREFLAETGLTVADVAYALRPFTLSSRFVARNFWADPKSGIGYQVQVQLAEEKFKSVEDLKNLPIKRIGKTQYLLRDVARSIRQKPEPGEYDRYNMKRMVSLTANIEGEDLGRVDGHITAALEAAGKRPAAVAVDVRGQLAPMRQMFNGLAAGLGLAVIAILLLLTANFQSFRLALVVVSTVPAVLTGVALALVVTGTTLNIQSFMGAIMAIGVAVANAILLVTFAERSRREGAKAAAAAVDGAQHRLRPILMTSCAMIAGMVPMALALGEGGEQTAPLARAVIGGLLAATLATLFLLPSVFAVVQGWASNRSPSLDPDDPASAYHDPSDRAPANEQETRDGRSEAPRDAEKSPQAT